MKRMSLLLLVLLFLNGCAGVSERNSAMLEIYRSGNSGLRATGEGVARAGYQNTIKCKGKLVDRGKVITEPAGANVSIVEKNTGKILLSGISPFEWQFAEETNPVRIMVEKEGYETTYRHPTAIDEYGCLFVILYKNK